MIKTILIVEDELLIAYNYQTGLINLGYNILGICVSGMEALKEIEENKPDAVIVDIELKGELSGLELVNKCKKMGIESFFVFASGNYDEKTYQEASILKPLGFLTKPIFAEQFDKLFKSAKL